MCPPGSGFLSVGWLHAACVIVIGGSNEEPARRFLSHPSRRSSARPLFPADAARRACHCCDHAMHTQRQQHEQWAHRRRHSTIPVLLRWMAWARAVVSLSVAVTSPLGLALSARAQQSPPFLVESLMDKLAFFGPTLDDGDWRARPMTRIAGECTERSQCRPAARQRSGTSLPSAATQRHSARINHTSATLGRAHCCAWMGSVPLGTRRSSRSRNQLSSLSRSPSPFSPLRACLPLCAQTTRGRST